MDTAKKTTYFKECCLAYKQTPTDEGVVAKFYTLLGQVKLYVVLEYGVCQLRQTEAGSVLCAYTEEPKLDPNVSGLAVVRLGIERLIQEVLEMHAQSLAIDPGEVDLEISKEQLEQLKQLLVQARNFKLKKLPPEKTLTLENSLRRVIKQDDRIRAAWVVGILLATETEYKYVTIIEYASSGVSGDEQIEFAKSLAEATMTVVGDGEVLFGSTDEVVGAKVKEKFVPFYIKR